MIPDLNKIYCGEFTEISKDWNAEIVDLTVTSPPYNGLRLYNGYTFDAFQIIERLYNLTKPGGIVVWIVGDETIAGSESGSSFEQALHFKKLGFNIHDTMIYGKNTSSFPARRDGNRYTQIYEFAFVFSKGKPKTANLICDKENRWKGWQNWGKNKHRAKTGELIETADIKPVPEFSPRNNIWYYNVGAGFGQTDKEAYKHPATMPFDLAKDHILSWSNPGDTILDPMCGSGTSLVGAKLFDRKYIGVDISQEFVELSQKRVDFADKVQYNLECEAIKLKESIKKGELQELLDRLTPDEKELLGYPKQYQGKKEKIC